MIKGPREVSAKVVISNTSYWSSLASKVTQSHSHIASVFQEDALPIPDEGPKGLDNIDFWFSSLMSGCVAICYKMSVSKLLPK